MTDKKREPPRKQRTHRPTTPATGAKLWFRKLEKTLDQIEQSKDEAGMLSAALENIVESFRQELGVVGGRLFQRRGNYYVLKHQTGKSRAPLGYRLSPDYAPIQELRQKGYLLMGEGDPGFDPRIEEVLGVKTFAAILVGKNNEYAISFTLRGRVSEARTAVALNTIRHVINLKLRQQALFDILLEAREIQVSLLPKSAPEMPEYDFYGRSVPAEVVGGDLYDYIPVSEGVMGVAIADASGHGLPAALQARDVVIGLRMGMVEDLKIVKTIQKLNRVINRSVLASKFISLFYGELESNGNFIYTNCGHPPPLLLQAGRFHELTEGGPVLGPLVGHRYLRGYVHLRPGDVLVLFTDGVPEAEDASERQFGVHRIRRCIAENAEGSSEEIVKSLFREVREFSGLSQPQDDQTVVVVKPRPV